MNKQELAEKVAKETDISKAKAYEAINVTFEAIKATLKKGQRVQLVGFGSFSVKQRKARQGRNPKTGEAVQIKARRVTKFTAGQELKSALN